MQIDDKITPINVLKQEFFTWDEMNFECVSVTQKSVFIGTWGGHFFCFEF